MDDQPALNPAASQPGNGSSPHGSQEQLGPAAASQPATKQQLDTVEQKMSAFERSTLRWAKLAVFLSAVAASFVYLQWREMHTGGQDTHALAVAAGNQATKMSNMSEAADQIRNASENMVTQEQRIADNADKAMRENSRQSAAVLRESTEASHLDQRAWVGAIAFPEPKTLDVGQKATFGAELTNTGKTPALNIQSKMMAWPFLKSVEFMPHWEPAPGKPSITVLQPGMHITLWTGPQSAPGTEIAISRLKSGEEIFYVYGETTYDDIFGKHHHTHFCGFLQPDLKNFSSCSSYNDAD